MKPVDVNERPLPIQTETKACPFRVLYQKCSLLQDTHLTHTMSASSITFAHVHCV